MVGLRRVGGLVAGLVGGMGWIGGGFVCVGLFAVGCAPRGSVVARARGRRSEGKLDLEGRLLLLLVDETYSKLLTVCVCWIPVCEGGSRTQSRWANVAGRVAGGVDQRERGVSERRGKRIARDRNSCETYVLEKPGAKDTVILSITQMRSERRRNECEFLRSVRPADKLAGELEEKPCGRTLCGWTQDLQREVREVIACDPE